MIAIKIIKKKYFNYPLLQKSQVFMLSNFFFLLFLFCIKLNQLFKDYNQ